MLFDLETIYAMEDTTATDAVSEKQRVFFKCKYCKVLFDTASTLVAHKRFEHADQIISITSNQIKGGTSR